jgi:hypothetical protein
MQSKTVPPTFASDYSVNVLNRTAEFTAAYAVAVSLKVSPIAPDPGRCDDLFVRATARRRWVAGFLLPCHGKEHDPRAGLPNKPGS